MPADKAFSNIPSRRSLRLLGRLAKHMRASLFRLLGMSLLLSGCSAVSYDRREIIATTTLFSPKGVLDEKAFSGALMEKISTANSPPAALSAFVESLGGKCGPALTGPLLCSIPQSGGFCISIRIDIEATVTNGEITCIRTRARNDGC